MSRHAIRIVALAIGTTALGAAAAGPVGVAGAQDAGLTRIEVRWERPPEGTLDRGLLGVPAWTVLGVGGVAVAAALVALIASVRRARRGPR